MTKRETLCDRCKKPIQYSGWTGIIKAYPKRLWLCELLNGNPDGYSYFDRQLDLCRDCCESLERWIKREVQP